jgi:hypothetical protein
MMNVHICVVRPELEVELLFFSFQWSREVRKEYRNNKRRDFCNIRSSGGSRSYSVRGEMKAQRADGGVSTDI